MNHNYNPDPKTGRCLTCTSSRSTGRGICAWCAHSKGFHTGRVPAVVASHYATARDDTGKITKSSIQWTPTACSADHCACRQYER